MSGTTSDDWEQIWPAPAKLNLFLGVPNLSVEFLPPHLGYLASYFSNKPMNLLFPASVTLASGAAGYAWGTASAEQTGTLLLATLLTLGQALPPSGIADQVTTLTRNGNTATIHLREREKT